MPVISTTYSRQPILTYLSTPATGLLLYVVDFTHTGSSRDEAHELIRLGRNNFHLVASVYKILKDKKNNFENSSPGSAECQPAICGPGLHLEALFDSISEGILTLDDDMRVTRANRAAAEILYTSPKELIGCHCAEVLLGRGESDGCTVCEALERKRHLDDERMPIIAKEGDRRTVRISTSPLRNPERERNEGYAVVLRDVTELEGLRRELQGRYRFHQLIGKSRQMREVYRLVEQAAGSDATVVVEGESGTGKELAARALHYNSHRAAEPFVPVHCAALAEGVLESELFGHAKGAFTGATSEKKGRFEVADGGTLFLDEVGEISPLIQLKLLRVLQEREIQRVGSNESIKVDVRIVAATNSRLNNLVSQGKFRQDLFYRLRVVAITIPSLRERREDIPLLVNHFIDKYREKTGKPIKDCQETIRLIKDVGCEDCEVTVLDANDPAVMQRARDAGACCCSVPLVLVDGEPLPCCAERRGPNEEELRTAGIGQG